MIVWDQLDNYWLTFGGANSTHTGCVSVNYTWVYQAGHWSNITSHSGFPMPREYGFRFFYDPTTNSVIIMGGAAVFGPTCTNSVKSSPYTYSFHSGIWSNISATAGLLPVQNSGRNQEWADWDANASDNYGYIYIWQGSFPGYAVDMKFVNSVWINITSSVHGPVCDCYDSIESYDGQNGKFVMVGGVNWSGGGFSSQKTYMYSHNTWTSTNGVGYPEGHGLSDSFVGYDAKDNYLISAFGGSNDGVHFIRNSTWKLVGTTWTNISFAHAPPARWETGWEGNATTMASWGGTTSFSNAVGSEVKMPGALYFFSSGNWSQAPFNPQVSGIVGYGPRQCELNECPRVLFNGTATGGTSPYTFHWKWGDGTSDSVHSNNNTGYDPTVHTFTRSGFYVVQLNVTDSLSVSAVTTVNVTVLNDPSAFVTTSTASPCTVSSASSTCSISFITALSFGTPPYRAQFVLKDQTGAVIDTSFGNSSSASTFNVSHPEQLAVHSYFAYFNASDYFGEGTGSSVSLIVSVKSAGSGGGGGGGGSPTGLTVSSFTSTSVTLMWSYLGVASSYVIYYGSSCAYLGNAVVVGTSLPATVSGLNPATTYCFAVAAGTSSGLTSQSAAVTATTSGGFLGTLPVQSLYTQYGPIAVTGLGAAMIGSGAYVGVRYHKGAGGLFGLGGVVLILLGAFLTGAI